MLTDCEFATVSLLDDWVYVSRMVDPETGELETDEVFDERREAEYEIVRNSASPHIATGNGHNIVVVEFPDGCIEYYLNEDGMPKIVGKM